MRRVVVVRRRRLDGVEARHGDRRDRRVRRPGDADVGPAVLDGVEGVAHRVEAGGAARGDGLHRSLRAEPLRDDGGQGAGRERQVQLRLGGAVVDVPALSSGADQDVVVLQAGRAADRAAEGDGDAPGVLGGEVDAAVGHGLVRGDQGELDVAVGAFGHRGPQPVGERVEVALGRDPRTQALGVEQGDAARGRAPVGEEVPERRYTDPARGYDADAGDRHPPRGHDGAPCRTGCAPASWTTGCGAS
ncbi:hypothetical protein SGLAM104S_09778 [Streptomyces glaucescens]